MRVLVLALAALAATAHANDKTIALKAGTVHTVAGGAGAVENGTVLIRGGKIVAVGVDVAVPANADVIDYGPDAVIVPGLVSANSNYGVGVPPPRTAAPGVRAIDNLDLYSSVYLYDLAGGVTTAYVPPGRNRLIAGQGAVIKLSGARDDTRVLSECASIHGAISDEARNTPGYWEIPVPATAQTGLGVEEPQLPRSLMGAVVALDELLDAARGNRELEPYGPRTAGELAALVKRDVPWRIDAQTAAEIRAIAAWALQNEQPLVLEGGYEAFRAAGELAQAGASAVIEIPIPTSVVGRDLGTGRDDAWPRYDTFNELVEANVRTAIATPDQARARDLRFAAAMARRGGVPAEIALRAITLTAAEILGVSQRVGSIEPGKDADFAVLNGPPLEITSSVLATWVDGEIAWKSAAKSSGSLVIEAEELHLGDGHVLRPGQVLIHDGRIVDVGEHVGHPLGAQVVRGHAAMPGMIDAYGYLGLEGSSKVPATDFKLARIVDSPDRTDRKVARSGVTTIVLGPRGPSSSGAPVMAYKPASEDIDRIVVEDPCAVRLAWTDRNRLESGKNVRELLEKLVEYDKKWKTYEEALAKWIPPKAAPADEPDDKKADEKKKDEGEKGDGDKKDEKASDDKKDDAKKDDKKEKKDKKDAKKEKADDEPLSGVWEAQVVVPPFAKPEPMRLRLERTDATVAGTLRCEPLSTMLVLVTGTFTDKALTLEGLSSRGKLKVDAKLDGDALVGKLEVGNTVVDFKASRIGKELAKASRPERRKPSSDADEPEGKPKAPGVDEKLEPLRKALRGEVAVIVDVDREDEILACVAAFEAVGIKPVLYGAPELWRVADQVRGRISGVLLAPAVLRGEPDEGLEGLINPHAELAMAGIRIALHSQAEEGAAELGAIALYLISQGLSPQTAFKALTSDAADMLGLAGRVGRIAPGMDGDVLVLDGPPLSPSTSVLRAFVDGHEVR